MGNSFERAGIPKTESVPTGGVVDWENFANSERGFLSKIAKSPLAKGMWEALAVMTGAMMLNAATPKEVQAFSEIIKNVETTLRAPLVEHKAASREYRRQIDREDRENYRLQREEGKLMAQREILQGGPFTYSPMGRRSSDKNAGPFYEGYMSVMRPYLDKVRRDVFHDAKERGKIKGRTDYESQKRIQSLPPEKKPVDNISAKDVLDPLLKALGGK